MKHMASIQEAKGRRIPTPRCKQSPDCGLRAWRCFDIAGNKNETSEISANVLYYFARNGFLGINATYRLAPKHVYPYAAQDIGGVVAWLKANAKRFGGNPERIYLIGRSSGALHVATWAFDPKIHGANGPGVAESF